MSWKRGAAQLLVLPAQLFDQVHDLVLEDALQGLQPILALQAADRDLASCLPNPSNSMLLATVIS